MIRKITSEHVLGWAQRVEAQRAQKALMVATKASKEFNALKKAQAKNAAHLMEQNQREEKLY